MNRKQRRAEAKDCRQRKVRLVADVPIGWWPLNWPDGKDDPGIAKAAWKYAEKHGLIREEPAGR